MVDPMNWPDSESPITPEQARSWLRSAREWWGWIKGLIRPSSEDSEESEESESVAPSSRILIVGRGGVGKTTLASLLSGDRELLGDPLNVYKQDLFATEHRFEEDSGRAVVVLPGQRHREDVWGEHLQQVKAGKYSGIILVGASGYHSVEETVYHQLKTEYGTTRRDDFLEKYLAEMRNAELALLSTIMPHVVSSQRTKMWILTLVSKMDLWFPNRAEVANFYQTEHQQKLQEYLKQEGTPQIRCEFACVSLVIRNLLAGDTERLAQNVEGFDAPMSAQTVLRLLDLLNGLRQWEEQK